MNIYEVAQGSKEWHQARAGAITGSKFVDARARLKSGPNRGGFTQAAQDYAMGCAIERLSGEPLNEGFSTWQMARGNELEPDARLAHEERCGVLVEQVGFVTTEDRKFGASADGFIGDDGGVEYKCLLAPSRITDVILTGDLSEFMDQIQGGMWVTGRKWWHFVLYMPFLASVGKDLFVFKVERDDEYIAELEKDLLEFDALVESKIKLILNADTGLGSVSAEPVVEEQEEEVIF